MLEETYPDSSYKFEIQVKRIPHSIQDKNPSDIKNIAFAGRGLPVGYSTFDVHYRRGNRTAVSKAQFLVTVWQKLPVTKKRLRKESRLEPELFTTRWVELNSASTEYITSPEETVGWITSRYIRSGEPITKQDLRKPVVIKAGDQLTMHLLDGGLRLSIKCTARQSAAAGEEIRVFNEQTRKTYQVKVLNHEEAKWIKTL